MTSLGTANEYTIAVTGKDGFGNIGFLEPSDLTWGRKLNDSSSSTVKVPLSSCCEFARGLRTWGHQIRVSRDDTLVWEGPIVNLDYGREELVVSARDVSVWLARRVVRSVLDFRAGADLSDIAYQLIEHAFQRDDPNVFPYVVKTLSGIVGNRYYGTVEPKYILDELNELGRTGIDWTVVGRRIAIFPELSSQTLPVLGQDDFLDELRVVEDGLAGATWAQVRGSGVTGEFGGEDAFYGLLERTGVEDNILDQTTATLRAEATVEAGNPVPLYITTPGQSRLACTAPVDINQLVPGVLVPITLAATDTCRPVSTLMRLLSMETKVSAGEETISVELALPGRTQD